MVEGGGPLMGLSDAFAVLPVASRSWSAENPDGAPGSGGTAASALGPGRKGSPCVTIPAGGTTVLVDATGPGIIRHIWITVPHNNGARPYVLRNLVLRMFWDEEATPSVEVPLGDFFCSGSGMPALITSLPIVVAPTNGMNCYFPMPFRRHARIELRNDHDEPVEAVFYQVDGTIGDDVDDGAGYFHALWRRSDRSAPLGVDHEILPRIEGRGVYAGTFVNLTALERHWWGEGEVKFFLDDDVERPTICGTGLEDYVGGAWAFQPHMNPERGPEPSLFSAPYSGYTQHVLADPARTSPYAAHMPPVHGMYRWHLPDPIYFHTSMRATLQQIGDHGGALFERCDDIATVAYWYQIGRTQELPPISLADARQPR